MKVRNVVAEPSDLAEVNGVGYAGCPDLSNLYFYAKASGLRIKISNSS